MGLSIINLLAGLRKDYSIIGCFSHLWYQDQTRNPGWSSALESPGCPAAM